MSSNGLIEAQTDIVIVSQRTDPTKSYEIFIFSMYSVSILLLLKIKRGALLTHRRLFWNQIPIQSN